MGNVYFNVLQVPCLEETYPKECVLERDDKCVKWEENRAEEAQLKFRTGRRQF